MAKHFELTEPNAIHPAAFVSATDPALIPANNVAAHKFWVDISTGPPFALKKRNGLNTLWEAVGTTGSASVGPAGPPGFAEEGGEGEPGPPGTPGPAGPGAAEDGWIAAGETWTFAAADAPTFTFTVPTDLTAKYTPGTRIKLTHAAAVKYFIVTASSFGASTTVTVYGGTDYTLAAGAITSPFFSRQKGPAGFPLSPAKWTLELSDSVSRTQASPVDGTWYNLGALSLAIPIGSWRVYYRVTANADAVSDTFILMSTTLSTGSTTESDAEMTSDVGIGGPTGALQVFTTIGKETVIDLAAKTSHFLNAKGTSSPANIFFRGDFGRTIVRAVSAYL